MLVDLVRMVNAAKTMALGDTFEFIKFDDISKEVEKDGPETIEIWASVKIPFKGKIPESYKILNLMIGDWVADHEEDLTRVIHEKLVEHFKEHYPESDTSELNTGGEDTSIWMDQLDYMPRMDEDSKDITIEIDLVLHPESVED
jgi:hypothetical protein